MIIRVGALGASHERFVADRFPPVAALTIPIM